MKLEYKNIYCTANKYIMESFVIVRQTRRRALKLVSLHIRERKLQIISSRAFSTNIIVFWSNIVIYRPLWSS